MNDEAERRLEQGLHRMNAALERDGSRTVEPAAERAPRDRRGQAAIFLIAAAVLVYLVLEGAPYWMLFIALGLGIAGVKRVFRGRGRRTRAAAGPAPSDRIDALCDALIEDLQRGPTVLREVVRRPEATISSLRDACHGLERRAREIRALVTPEDDARLAREREGLVSRLGTEGDPETRRQLQGALEALDSQVQQRATLSIAASRLEAERTRIGYTLESLHTQVLAVKNEAGHDPVAGERLREGLQRLGDEISAVAGALEAMQPVDPGAVPVAGQSSPGVRERS